MHDAAMNSSVEYLKKYDLYDTCDCPHNINTFAQIGWPDPFPKENSFTSKISKPTSINDLVYDKNRLFPRKLPKQVYIPRKELMLKMMRACVGVKEEEQVWVEQK